MKKFTAFTLAETTLALVIMGVLAVITMRLVTSDEINSKAKLAKAYAAFTELQKAAVDIRTTETAKCPEGIFITKMRNPGKNFNDSGAYSYEYALLGSSGYATSAETVALFADHMDLDQESLNFCDKTSYCSNSAIKGFKMTGDIYVGIEITANTSTGAVSSCPTEYYMPAYDKEKASKKQYFEKVTKSSNWAQCWGKIYVFLSSRTPKNAPGTDIFVWGLGENGIAY